MAIKSAKDLYKDRDKLASQSRIRSARDRVSEEDLKKFYDTVQGNINYWMDVGNSFVDSTNSYYKNLDTSSYGLNSSNLWKNSATARNNWLTKEADNIDKILTEYGRYFDSDWISSVRSAMSNVKNASSSILKQADKDIEYWQSWDEVAKKSGMTAEEAYKNAYFTNKYKDYSYEDILKASDEIRNGGKKVKGELSWLVDNADNFMSAKEAQAEIDAISKEFGLDDMNWFEKANDKVQDFFRGLVGAEDPKYGWAQDRIAKLTTIKANAERKEKFDSMVAEAKGDAGYNDYIKKGKAEGQNRDDHWEGLSYNVAYASDIIAVKEGKATASGDGFYQKFINAMDEEQYNNYVYFFGKYGKDVADEYLRGIETEINEKEGQRIKELVDVPLIDDLFHITANFERWASDIGSIFSDEYKAPSAIQIADQMRGAEKEGISKVLWDLEGNIAYQIPNMLGGTVATAILGPAGFGVMSANTAGMVGQLGLTGLSSFGGAKQEMLNLGYSEGQAFTYGALTAASEVGLGALLGKIGNVTGIWTDDAIKSLTKGLNSAGAKFAIEFGAGLASEGLEEALQEILDPVFMQITTGKKAEDIDWGQVAYAGMLGALSAGVLNGLGAVGTRANELSLAKDIKSKKGWADSVKNLGNTFAADTLAYKLASKVDENTGAWKLADVIHEMHGTLSEQNVADIKYQLERNGILSKDAQTIAEWLGKAVDGEHFTALQRKALDNNPIISRVFKKVVIDQNSTVNQRLNAIMNLEGVEGHAGVDYSAIAKSQSNEGLSKSATFHQFVEGAKKDAIKDKYNIGRPTYGNYDATLDAMVNKTKEAKANAKINESGVTTNTKTGKQISINRVTETDGKTATYALADGTTISNKDVEYSDNDEGLLYEGAISLGNGMADVTNAIIHGIKGVDLPVIAYLNGVDEAIEYGRIGYPMDKISTNGFYADLPDSMKTYAYNLGKESAKKDTAKAQAKIDANKGKVEKAREGEVVHLYEKSGLTPRQEASLTTLGKVVSDITHNKVYIFDTVEKTINGKKVRVFAKDTAGFKAGTPADNGFINKATGEIYIDLHAGMNGEGVILWTLAHELTHFVRQWSPAKFNVLADFLMAEYGKQGVDVQTLIDNKVANSRNKHTRDQAYEEVVADAMQTMFTDTDLASKLEKLKNKDKGLWEKIKAFFADLYKRIKGEYKDVDAQTDEAKKVREMSEKTIKRLSDLFAEGIVDAGDTFANLDVEGVMTDIANSLPSESTATTDPNSMVAHSYRSFAEACGFEAYEDPDTSIRLWRFKGSANSVNEVTEHQIRNSPIGALINYSATKKYISYEDAHAQYKMFAEIANMCIKQQDFAQAMQFVGSMVFTGMKANADKQYKTTYDFPSICTKTQAVIDAMSDAMIKKGAGLTKAELEALYRKVWEMGNPVPCPECYVFSRWVGIGGLLDNIRKYQDTYSKMTMAEVEAEYQKMRAEIEEFSKANGISFGKAKGKIFDLYAKEEAKLMDEIAKFEEAGDIVPQSKKDRLAKISLQKDTTKAMSWIHKVYFANESHTKVNPNYLVPNEVLFDLNAGETFATKYKEAWGFRTTQGAGYGKAITPYAEAVLGEGINVTNNTTKTIKEKANRDTSSPKSNIFLEQNGTLSNEAIRVLETARKKQLAQAFLGGQRLQSMSDARYENVTDYLIAAIEMQAMHSKAQVYTKVSGAVEAFNNWGFAINQSLMPLNSGLTKDGRLKDTSSGGMKVDVAYANRTKYENAGTITIGVNDAHIRTLFRERGRDFIIPYHASGGDQTLIREFRRIQDSKAGNETFVQSCDYSKTQSEKELPTSLLRELGYTEEQIADVEKFREQRLAILTRNKAVDKEYIRAEGNEVLARLYDEFNGGIWDGVKLTKDTVGTAIFPNEYWDKSVDYDNSSKITEDYLEYCHRLGFLHKFSGKSIQYNKNLQKHQLIEVMGYNENGERVALTNLAYIDGDPSKGVEQFYWKSLTDRRMYGNDGKYLEQKFVTLGNADASVAETFAKDNEGSVREYSKEKSDETLKTIKVEDGKVSLADNMMFSERKKGSAYDRLTEYVDASVNLQASDETNIRDFLYSDRNKDAEYLNLAKNPEENEARLRQLVEEAARNAGYNSPKLYHGTKMFGFTKVKTSGVEKGVEWSPFFAANKEDISASYVPYGKVRDIYSSMDDDAIEEARESAIEKRKENISDLVDEFRSLIDRHISPWVLGQTDNSYLEELVEEANPEPGSGDGVYDVLSEVVFSSFYDYQDELGEYEDADDWAENSPEGNEIFSKIVEIEGEKSALHSIESGEELGGIYQLYANLDNMYAVDGKGAAWNELRPEGLPKIDRHGFKDVPYKTRDVAEWARENGFDGVIFKNIRDNGAYGRTPAGDVYVFFHPESQVKSADPVTYDENGNIIPLSERFNSAENDIRFSERTDNSIDNRSLLANALESVAQNDVEREWLTKYKSQIESLNEDQNKLAELRAEIQKIRFTKGQDRSKLPALENQAKTLANRISKADKKLLEIEVSKPLKGVLERERAKAYKIGMEKLAEYRRDRAESKALNYYRPRIEKIVSDLHNRLAHPSAKTAIPEVFGANVAKVLMAFDFTTYDSDGNVRPSKKNVSRAEARESLKTLATHLKLNSIENMYGQLDVPTEMVEWIESVATYFEASENLASNGFDVNKMNGEQLKNAYKFLRSLQTAINNVGKYYSNAHYDVKSDATSTMDYVGKLPTERNEAIEKASKIFKWDFASPVTVFDRFGEGGKHVYSMLVKGQSKMAYNVQEVLDFVEKAYTEKEAKEWREKLVTVEIGGEEYNVTIEMLMGLHCLLKQEDSRRHILEGGGIRFADVKHKGKVKRFENIFFNEIDAMAVEKALDAFPRAREVAEAMQSFMEKVGSSWGNEVSMIRFGYHAFTTPNYYPIRTVAAGSEYEAQQKRANIYALLNKSFTKERTPGANNAVIVDGIFSVFNNHMAEMALYNAWALPVIDTIKWFNYKENQDIDAKTAEKSVHETFRLAYGTYADEYVRRLLESINSQTDGGLSEGFAFRQLRKVNRVAVSWNVRVAVQQPFSVARAYELINPKYVTPLVGKARDAAYEEMLANSGIAKWKSMGYYDVDVSRPLETQVMKNASVADKFTEVGMKAAEDGDSFTWTALWNACKKETAEKNKGISEAELLKKTAERFDDLILRTQVVDSVLAKSQWMRSKSFWHRSTSAFMSEPLTSYNTLLRQMDKFERDKALHGIKYAVKNNAKGVAKVTSVFIFSQLLNALITAPLDALRDDDDYETYLEKLLANFKENAFGNLMPWNMLPWISDVADYFLYGRTYRADMAYAVNVIDLARSIYNLTDNYSYYKLHNTFNKALAVASQTSGFAVSNIFRDAVAMWNAVAGEIGYGELKFQTKADTHTEGYKRMYDAIVSGDEDRAGYLYGQLLSNELDEEKVYNGLVKLISKEVKDGKITDEKAIERMMAIIGITGKVDSEGNAPTENDVYWMIDKWKYQGENGNTEGYSKYDDIFTAMEDGDPTSAVEWHIEDKTKVYLEEARREAEKDGKTFNEVKAKKEAEKKAESAVKSAVTSYWKPKYKEAYEKGDTEEMKRIRYMLKATKLYGTTSDLLDTVKGWLKD